jgi:hypothetical protein
MYPLLISHETNKPRFIPQTLKPLQGDLTTNNVFIYERKFQASAVVLIQENSDPTPQKSRPDK